MEPFSLRIVPEPVRSLVYSSTSSSYAVVGTPLDNPSRIILFQNFTDGNMMVSWDGVNDHLPVAANGFILLDITSNKTSLAPGFYVSKGSSFYIKRISTPSTGSFYISSFYGNNT